MAAANDDADAIVGEINALPLTRLHVFILIVCALGFSFDLAEIAFGGILSAIFSAPPNPVEPFLLAWLLAAVYIGAIGGAPLLGWLADGHGRQRVMFWALAILTVRSVAAALSPNMIALIVFRGLSGLALGAYPPLMIAFMTDIFPAARRGALVFAAVAIGYLGPPALIFFVRWLGPDLHMGLEAWRWAFLVAGTGAAVCTVLSARLSRVLDNDADYVTPNDMLAELQGDNADVAARMCEMHVLCEAYADLATAALLDTWVDEADGRAWFLFEARRPER